MPMVVTAAAVLVLASSVITLAVRRVGTETSITGVGLLEMRQRVLVAQLTQRAQDFVRSDDASRRRSLQTEILDSARLLERSQAVIDGGGTAPAGEGLLSEVVVPRRTAARALAGASDAAGATTAWITRLTSLAREVAATGVGSSSVDDRLAEMSTLTGLVQQQDDIETAQDEGEYVHRHQAMLLAIVGATVAAAGICLVWLLGVRPVLRDRRRARGADRRSALVEDAGDVVALVAADGTVIVAGPALAPLVGRMDPREVTGAPLASLFQPADAPELDAMLATALAHDVARSTVSRRASAARKVDLVAVSMLHDREIGGVVIRGYEALSPTDRVDLLEAVQQMIAAFAAMFGKLDYAVLIVDAAERIVTVNQQFCQVFGIDGEPAELTGSSARLMFHSIARHTDDTEKALGELRSTGQGDAAVEEDAMVLADGRTFVRIFVPIEAHGERLGMWVFWETTERRRAMVALEQARDEAAAALARMSTMLAVASHEVRGHMQGIMALTEELGHTGLDPDQRSVLSSLHDAGASLRRVVDQMLNLSRLESGALGVSSVRMDLRNVVRESTAVVAGMLAAKSIRFDVQFQTDLAMWRAGDPVRVGEILTNLLVNAAKYTDAGSVSLSVRRGQGDRVRFSAGDTGPGISGEAIRRLVNATPESGLGPSAGGLGLGLLITRQIVEMLGGTMSVSSKPGQGTLFTVDLPLPPLEAPRTSSVIDLTGGAESIGRPHVLVVDDSPEALTVMCQMLRRLGAEVDSTPDPYEAVRRCRERRFDLVVLDNLMPILDGPSTAELIRADEQRVALSDPASAHRAAIIAATADVSPDISARCLAAGMDAYLAKPFSMAELRQVIQEVLPSAARANGQPVADAASVIHDPAPEAARQPVAVLVDSDMTRDLAAHPQIVIDGYATFVAMLDGRLAAIRSAIDTGTDQEVADSAHHLGSPALVMGAEALGRRCRELEQAAREGSGRDVTAPLLDEIERQAVAARGAMLAQAERLRGSLSR